MKKVLLANLLVFISLVAFAESKGDVINPLITAVPSLTITPDARAGGMGDVGAATSPDANSQYWNPAKYALMDSPGGLSLSYTPWMSKIVNDINLLYLSGFYKFKDVQAVSASVRYFSLGDIDLTDPAGTPQGQTSPYEMALDLAYSRMLSERWSAAVGLRYIRVDFGAVEELYPGNAFAADVAAYYRLPIDFASSHKEKGYFSAGLNIANIGTKISYDEGNTDYFIPTNMRLGASFSYPIDDFNRITASVDLNKLLVPNTPKVSNYGDGTSDLSNPGYDEWKNDHNDYLNQSVVSGIFSSFNDAPGGFSEEMKEIAIGVGLEYEYNKQFMLRTGYFHEDASKGNRKFFTFGAGFKLYMMQIDASYVLSSAQTNPLDQTLRFSLIFDANGLRDLTR